MKRALSKAAVQLAFGRSPGGPALYRKITREVLGTQAGYLTKMQTRWRPYAERWRDAGVPADARLWVHDAGWTPLIALLGWLDFGVGVTLTDAHARMQAQHLAASVDMALSLCPDAPADRRAAVKALRWAPLDVALKTIDAQVLTGCDETRIALPDASIDVCHSGGALEHSRPAALRAFLGECARVVRPGGLISHVVDHRDHLFHTDKAWPFQAHWALPEWAYQVGFGHALGYHNRLPPTQVTALFEAAGLERVAVIRRFSDGTQGETVPAGSTPPVGLSRRWTRPRWRDVPAIDRCTWAAHYLFRVPD